MNVMSGVWFTEVESGFGEIVLTFIVEEYAGQYRLGVYSSPSLYSFEAGGLCAEGNRLRASGWAEFFAAEMAVELEWEENGLCGTIELPFVGILPFTGRSGRPTPSHESLDREVASLRSGKAVARTENEMRAAVEELLKQMTLTEKIGQMSQVGASSFAFGGDVDSESAEELVEQGRAGSILGAFDMSRVLELQRIAVERSRLGIPLLFNADIVHGHQTIFPVPLAWSCSWDMEAIRRACAIAAKEAAASGITFNHAPMVDVTRDPRWGRVVEGAGEDPFLGAAIAKAQVQGFQGDSLLDEHTMIACLKHFLGYGAAEGGRDYNTVDMSERTMREVYLPPFRSGIEAGAEAVMNAFNLIDHVPVAGSRRILKELLRDELGFDGVLISDYGAIDELVVHGYSASGEEAAEKAVKATMDIEMVTRLYATHLPGLIEQGRVDMSLIDDAVRRILTAKFKLGLMDDPYRYIRPQEALAHYMSAEHLEASRDLARRSIVLLRNEGALPLVGGQRLAVIGPFAASRDLLGPWQFSSYSSETVTLMEGLDAKRQEREGQGLLMPPLLYAEGCRVKEPIEGGIAYAVEQAAKADVIVLALGESSGMSGEAASRMDITLPEAQLELADAIVKLGKPVVLVLTNGRPLVLGKLAERSAAIIETWYLGSQAGHAIADVLCGDYNPTGKLTMSFPASVGQIPVYYNRYHTGRPLHDGNRNQKFISKYIDGPNEPLYPFGYGLSYTSFAYSDLVLSTERLARGATLTAEVTVTNTGVRAGEETVQLYIQDIHGSVVRPIRELKGFSKLWLEPGESRQAVFTVSEELLRYTGADRECRAEDGAFKLFVGGSSAETLEAAFMLYTDMSQ